jgi:hypothetical protein
MTASTAHFIARTPLQKACSTPLYRGIERWADDQNQFPVPDAPQPPFGWTKQRLINALGRTGKFLQNWEASFPVPNRFGAG